MLHPPGVMHLAWRLPFLLYMPLGISAFYHAVRWEELTLADGIVAGARYPVWMAVP